MSFMLNYDLFGVPNDLRIRRMFKMRYDELTESKKLDLTYYYARNKGRTYMELYDDLVRAFSGHGDAPAIEPKLFMWLKPDSKEKTVDATEIEVKGPFHVSVYDDPAFVARYTEVRYETRCSDIEQLLWNVEGRIVAVGDGAGTAFEAVRRLRERGRNIECVSYDNSQTMCDIASELGNYVTCKSADDIVFQDGDIYLLSHVTDYMSDDFLQRVFREKVIVFGRATTFRYCHMLRPYKKRWGYQVCMHGIDIGFINLVSVLKQISDIDYSVMGLLITDFDKHVCVDDLPLYTIAFNEVGVIVNSNLENSCGLVTMNDFSTLRAIPVAVPHFGVFNEGSVASLLVVCPTPLMGYMSSFSHYHSVNPLYCGKKFLFTGTRIDVKYGSGYKTVKFDNVCGYKAVRFKEGTSVVMYDCTCSGLTIHVHAMNVCKSREVEWRNFRSDYARMSLEPATRNNLYAFYSSFVKVNSFARFTHFERVANVLYDSNRVLRDE